jgi:hypothetical protein
MSKIHIIKIEALFETEIDFSKTELTKQEFDRLSFSDKIGFIKKYQLHDPRFIQNTDIEVYSK